MIRWSCLWYGLLNHGPQLNSREDGSGGEREQQGKWVEMGVAIGEVNPANMLKSDTPGSDKLEGKEVAGSR